jgi:protoporphyrinogen oxidase
MTNKVAASPATRLAIIGAGSAGLTQLKNALEVFARPEVKTELEVVVFESKTEVGGVWYVTKSHCRSISDVLELIAAGTLTGRQNTITGRVFLPRLPMMRVTSRAGKQDPLSRRTSTRERERTHHRCTKGSERIFHMISCSIGIGHFPPERQSSQIEVSRHSFRVGYMTTRTLVFVLNPVPSSNWAASTPLRSRHNTSGQADR